MDLFSQLDRHNSELTGEQIVMVRYRIRFHREIIYSHLSTNPSVSQEEIAAAVAINRTAEFLPQPWPPLSLNDPTSIFSVSLIKMKAIENVGIDLPTEASSAKLTEIISRRFPERALIPSTSRAVRSCEARISQNGDVTGSYAFSELSGELSHERKYVQAMVILGMQRYLETLG